MKTQGGIEAAVCADVNLVALTVATDAARGVSTRALWTRKANLYPPIRE